MNIVVKEFEGNEIRTHVDEYGEPWFVAADVCKVLGIKYQRHALRKLDEDERGVVQLPGEAGIREFSTVNESGLYSLVLESKKPSAVEFKRWLRKEVIPAIRKTGTYSTKQLTPAEELLAHAQFAVDQERKIMAANNRINVVDKKVDNLGTTVNQLMMHRRGNDPVPAGTIPTKKIRFKYFYGVSEDVIRDFLTERNHPKVPFTFITPAGSDLPSFAWHEEGLKEQYEHLIMTGDYIKSTDKNWIFSHPLLANNFRVKRDEIPASYKKLIEAKTREL